MSFEGCKCACVDSEERLDLWAVSRNFKISPKWYFIHFQIRWEMPVNPISEEHWDMCTECRKTSNILKRFWKSFIQLQNDLYWSQLSTWVEKIKIIFQFSQISTKFYSIYFPGSKFEDRYFTRNCNDVPDNLNLYEVELPSGDRRKVGAFFY